MKKFHCRAGTVLNGTSEIYCDGKKWSGAVPVCVGKGWSGVMYIYTQQVF